MKILVIEDDWDIEELLQFFLEDNGYQVAVARDGLEGITSFQEGEFGLILLDIMLPKIDGYAVCELIRKQSDIPIIMITALSDEENQIKGLDLMADIISQNHSPCRFCCVKSERCSGEARGIRAR